MRSDGRVGSAGRRPRRVIEIGRSVVARILEIRWWFVAEIGRRLVAVKRFAAWLAAEEDLDTDGVLAPTEILMTACSCGNANPTRSTARIPTPSLEKDAVTGEVGRSVGDSAGRETKHHKHFGLWNAPDHVFVHGQATTAPAHPGSTAWSGSWGRRPATAGSSRRRPSGCSG